MLATKRVYRPIIGMTPKAFFVCGLGRNTAEGVRVLLLPVSPSQLEGGGGAR